MSSSKLTDVFVFSDRHGGLLRSRGFAAPTRRRLRRTLGAKQTETPTSRAAPLVSWRESSCGLVSASRRPLADRHVGSIEDVSARAVGPELLFEPGPSAVFADRLSQRSERACVAAVELVGDPCSFAHAGELASEFLPLRR